LIRKRVSQQFYLAEMRDPDLKVRSHRRLHALPRQLAMYLVRKFTGASLQEIGRQFGGRHHTTVLHSIYKIEELRESDKALNCAITRLMDAIGCNVQQPSWGKPHSSTGTGDLRSTT
jgi:chromosomal replication initiator protein